jgi:deoxycytidylate deaminase
MEKLRVIEGEKVESKRHKNIQEKIRERQSKILVIAFCGPVGSRIPSVVDLTAELLKGFNYESQIIKMSNFIKKHIDRTNVSIPKEGLEKDTAQRIITLQNAGNELRSNYLSDILSQFAITEIGICRHEKILKEDTSKKAVTSRETPHRLAFLIDSIKHPDEINLLRTVYGNMFYLFGILCAEPIRFKNLKDKGFSDNEAHEVIERDKKQDEEYGQQLVKALQYADFFIRNNHPNIESLKKQIQRFFDLIFNAKIVTPTRDEFAMFIAQSSALRSACLSRQIGAAILNEDGEIVSTGCNDVPIYGGGLYTIEHEEKDSRCAYLQDRNCKNDEYKNKLKERIKEIVKDDIRPEKDINSVVNNVYEETWLKDVLEFSRAVHAEMAAIVSAARNGYPMKGSTLYTLTFPCHNCARHIVAAGIKKVIYIEPYEKSRALELHYDSIDLDPIEYSGTEKVVFLHFEGIAPRQYLNLFRLYKERKKDGKMITQEAMEALPVIPEYLDTFVDYESQVTEHLKSLGFIN